MLVRMGGKSLLFEYLCAHHWWSSPDLKEFRLGAVIITQIVPSVGDAVTEEMARVIILQRSFLSL